MYNRLKNKICYEIGPIDRCPDLGTSWRAELEKELTEKYGVNVYNPRNKPIDIGLETPEQINQRRQWKSDGNYDEFVKEIKVIRHVDLRMCDRCDFAICYMDLNIHMCGTYEEMFWLNRAKKPVLIWCEQGKKLVPDWLWGVFPHEMFFSTKQELLKYLDYIHSAPKIEDHRRWLFFDR